MHFARCDKSCTAGPITHRRLVPEKPRKGPIILTRVKHKHVRATETKEIQAHCFSPRPLVVFFIAFCFICRSKSSIFTTKRFLPGLICLPSPKAKMESILEIYIFWEGKIINSINLNGIINLDKGFTRHRLILRIIYAYTYIYIFSFLVVLLNLFVFKKSQSNKCSPGKRKFCQLFYV